jgi:hypothetical protein
LHAAPTVDIAVAASDADLSTLIAVAAASLPDQSPPRLENLRHIVATSETVVFLVARVEGEPTGCGFVDWWPEEHARAHCLVIPSFRRLGIGSVFLAEIGRLAVEAGRSLLLGDVIENDGESLAYLQRRSFEVVGAERAVVLELADHVAVAPEPPPAVDIVALADRPDLGEALYESAWRLRTTSPGVREGCRTSSGVRVSSIDPPVGATSSSSRSPPGSRSATRRSTTSAAKVVTD